MTYVLVIWTIVAMTGPAELPHEKWDWRPLLTFTSEYNQGVLVGEKTAEEMCKLASKELNIRDRYICVRVK